MAAVSDLVIDCHGHFTSEPDHFLEFRRDQIAAASNSAAGRRYPGVNDRELHDAITANQLRLQQERGTDVTLLSPRAAGMGHHVPDGETAAAWARLSNDTVGRICELFPQNFAPVCQLPQTIDGDLGAVVDELVRCVEDGFVGCNVNPDPSGGRWSSPPLTDPWWDPLWVAMIDLNVPAMIHVSASTSTAVHTTGAYYLAADTIVFMQLLAGDLFERHPGLRLVIPHGGGAVPYHWGRYRGMALAFGKPDPADGLLRNVFFDTCVYHQAGIDLLFDVIPSSSLLFGSELLGAVKTADPDTGQPFDDTRQYIDQLHLPQQVRDAVLETNVRRVYPRLNDRLTAQGR